MLKDVRVLVFTCVGSGPIVGRELTCRCIDGFAWDNLTLYNPRVILVWFWLVEPLMSRICSEIGIASL